MESGDAMESVIEYAACPAMPLDSGGCIDATYQCVFQEEDGEGHRGINLNKDLPDGHRRGRTQGQHHGHRAPGAAHLGRAAVCAPPSSCCLSAEAHHYIGLVVLIGGHRNPKISEISITVDAGVGSKGKSKLTCRKCKQEGDHDARNCPNNVVS
ncbi:hypothetical protein OsI_33874 [Oryza sativa Indica Group]|uniref:Uncharacterized protein n=1 Tax=Oryza sativa subsp. indica TaxID=39946 RepID=B8BH87_ORYSI|nr:hypothetical protein OsI_33874 [Oryza sativa Indica Group]